MVLRAEVIQVRLKKIEEVISRLSELGSPSANQLRKSFRDAWAAERGIHLGAEALFDVGNHILSSHFGVQNS